MALRLPTSCAIKNTLSSKIWSNKNINTNDGSIESFKDSRPIRSHNANATIVSNLGQYVRFGMKLISLYVINYVNTKHVQPYSISGKPNCFDN